MPLRRYEGQGSTTDGGTVATAAQLIDLVNEGKLVMMHSETFRTEIRRNKKITEVTADETGWLLPIDRWIRAHVRG